jgi:hypothetical protein
MLMHIIQLNIILFVVVVVVIVIVAKVFHRSHRHMLVRGLGMNRSLRGPSRLIAHALFATAFVGLATAFMRFGRRGRRRMTHFTLFGRYMPARGTLCAVCAVFAVLG